MSDTFFSKSKEIANDFIQSVVFLDDKAYNSSDERDLTHDFDALKITQAFAQEKKICAVYKPILESDIEDFKYISEKADVIILDWFIEIKEVVTPEIAEQDAKDDEVRGKHTINIIEHIFSYLKDNESLKLIIVYTGETDLEDITQTIYKKLNTVDKTLKSDLCKIENDYVKILVKAKVGSDEDGNKFKHLPKLQPMLTKYEDLPKIVSDEFTLLTQGVLSCFALKSLTLLRKNSFRLLKLYNSKLDNAFLLHKLLLPNPNDANEQLIQNFSQSLEAMLNYINDNNSVLSIELIDSWLEEININKTKKICKQDIEINTDFLKKWLRLGYSRTFSELWEEKSYDIKQLNELDKTLSKVAKEEGVKFLKEDNNPEEDSNFSILTLHKSNVKHTSSVPKLALGSIIKHIVTDNKTEYFLCIQAKCDSIRFENDRRFIFLELDVQEGNKNFNLLARNINNEVLKFKYRNKSYDLKTFKFKTSEDKDSVFAKWGTDSLYFETTHNEKLIWLCDLKDMQAQRISNIIASQISRVGLDESEWLRRYSN